MRLIDADALIDRLDFCVKEGMGRTIAFTFKHMVEEAPTIDVVPKDFHDKTCEAMAQRHTEEIQRLMPKRGEWIDFKFGWKCNACKKWNSEKSNFCPNCGCRMKGTDDFVKTHEVVANGNCAICGKPLSGDRIFVCEECNNNVSSESERSR